MTESSPAEPAKWGAVKRIQNAAGFVLLLLLSLFLMLGLLAHSSLDRASELANAVGLVLLLLLGLCLSFGLIPQSSAGLASEPAPVATYAQAVQRFETIEQQEHGAVNSVSASRLLSHGGPTPRVYVMVHGTTNSPLQWLGLGQMLFDRGHNVLIPLMPRHGLLSGQVSELGHVKTADLRAYADEAIDIAAGLGDEVMVVGVSGGGAVAAWMAANRPEVVRTLLLAPFFGVKGLPAYATTFLLNTFSRLPNINFDRPTELPREWVYRGQASRGVVTFLSLGREVLRQARAGIVPGGDVVVITTAVDNTASNTVTTQLLDLWQRAGVPVTAFEFGANLAIPHNSVDPAADAVKRQIVYDEVLNLLGE